MSSDQDALAVVLRLGISMSPSRVVSKVAPAASTNDIGRSASLQRPPRWSTPIRCPPVAFVEVADARTCRWVGNRATSPRIRRPLQRPLSAALELLTRRLIAGYAEIQLAEAEPVGVVAPSLSLVGPPVRSPPRPVGLRVPFLANLGASAAQGVEQVFPGSRSRQSHRQPPRCHRATWRQD